MFAQTAERAAAAHCIAQPVAERANAGAGHVQLGCVHAALVAGDFAEVPAFTINVDFRAVHAVILQRQALQRVAHLEDVGLHVMAHQVEAETVYFVLGSPSFERVNHQFFHHRVFGGGVLATRAGFHIAGIVQTMIIARNNPIQH